MFSFAKRSPVKICTILMSLFLLSACVYRIDVSQGNPLTRQQIDQVQVGMTSDQVSYYLGTPSIQDPTEPDSWIYIYKFVPGTYGKRYRIPATRNQNLKIVFDQNGLVTQVIGAEHFPSVQPMVPSYSTITGKAAR